MNHRIYTRNKPRQWWQKCKHLNFFVWTFYVFPDTYSLNEIEPSPIIWCNLTSIISVVDKKLPYAQSNRPVSCVVMQHLTKSTSCNCFACVTFLALRCSVKIWSGVIVGGDYLDPVTTHVCACVSCIKNIAKGSNIATFHFNCQSRITYGMWKTTV